MKLLKGGRREQKRNGYRNENRAGEEIEMSMVHFPKRKEIRNVQRKEQARGIMCHIWNIGERKFENNYKRRIYLFDAQVKIIQLYGVEIGGWAENEMLKNIQNTF